MNSTVSSNTSRFLSIVILLLLTMASGCVQCCPKATSPPPGTSANEVIQEFPAGGPTQTAWRVRWAEGPGKGLYITGAWFKRNPAEAWMRILWDARVADIFVPYHTGSPRYYDLTGFGFGLVDAVQKDAGCCGVLLGNPPKVVKEVRDRGVVWKDDKEVHRGQQLVLWGTVDAANYNYIIEYGFRDDGVIEFRIGATARNLPGREMEGHMHNGLWRIDVDLNGFSNDSALLARHQEPAGGMTASDSANPFHGGTEGSAVWNPQEFTHIRVVDTVRKNGKGHNISYDLIPMPHGVARHVESFTQADFWVTRYHGTELRYDLLPTYVSNGESVTNTDIVLWHITPVHHMPRDEDGEFRGDFWRGSALIMWGGFDLRPRNFFDRTPLFPY